MTTRRARDRQHKRIVGVGLVVSVALHAVLLAGLDFVVPETEATVGSAEPNADVPFEFVSMELVNIEEVEPLPEEPMIADDRPVLADPAPDQVADAPAGDPTPAGPAAGAPARVATGAPPPAAAPSAADLIASLERQSSVDLAMRPQFVAQRGVPGALDAIDAVDAHAGHDHDEEEGDNQESWWRRLGVPLGSGGTKICKPARPPVVVHKAAATP
ncbi:MAG: hypothetical protein OXH49_03260 [Gemmatimonadetes bacterium]|nr:hypothetical protein [Gemmatimonadota bacterium]